MIENKSELNWRLFWNTRKEFVLSILFFVFAFLMIIVGIFQQISPLSAQLSQVKARETEVNKYKSKATNLEEIASSRQVDTFTEVDKVLPSHKPLLEVLTNLNNVAQSTQVVIENFSLNPGNLASDSTQVKKSSSGSAYDYLDLDFSVVGPLWKVQNFMTLIEQTTPISTITSISINRDITKDSNAEARANLILRSFYFTQPIKTTISSALPQVADSQRQILDEINQLIPNNLESQTEVIKGNRGNLFGLQDVTVQELQEQLGGETATPAAESNTSNPENNPPTESSPTP
jgi:Tfp pilus assembly protein PilO